MVAHLKADNILDAPFLALTENAALLSQCDDDKAEKLSISKMLKDDYQAAADSFFVMSKPVGPIQSTSDTVYLRSSIENLQRLSEQRFFLIEKQEFRYENQPCHLIFFKDITKFKILEEDRNKLATIKKLQNSIQTGLTAPLGAI
jgi:hypothetical protein